MNDTRTRTQLRAAGEWRRATTITETVSRKDGGGTRTRPNPHAGVVVTGPARSYLPARRTRRST